MQIEYKVQDGETVLALAGLSEVSAGVWSLDGVHVDPADRNNGYGSDVLAMVTADADLDQVIVTLAAVPGPDYSWASAKNLVKWFGRNGWISEPGDLYSMSRPATPPPMVT